MAAILALAACGAEPISAPTEDIQSARYAHPGPNTLTLLTVISNRSGAGGHSGLLINGSERVVWDPAGTWWSPNAPERNDLHFGMTPYMFDVYVDYHTRETYHTVTQTIEVSPEVAEQAFQLAANYGAVSKAACALSTSDILSQLPGFESISRSYFPTRIRDAFAELPGVTTEVFYDDDSDDNSALLPQS